MKRETRLWLKAAEIVADMEKPRELLGLCYGFSDADDPSGVGAAGYGHPRLELFNPRKGFNTWWPCNQEGDDCRILAACFLAAMAEVGEPV